MEIKATVNLTFSRGYSEVNGLKMYYEIYGQGKPIVLIHGGGSTIQTSFEKIIPPLSKNRQVKDRCINQSDRLIQRVVPLRIT